MARVTGENILRQALGNVDSIELSGHDAVVRIRTEPGGPARPIRIDFSSAVKDAGDSQSRRFSASPLVQLLLLLGLARYAMRLSASRDTLARPRIEPEDRWRVRGK